MMVMEEPSDAMKLKMAAIDLEKAEVRRIREERQRAEEARRIAEYQ